MSEDARKVNIGDSSTIQPRLNAKGFPMSRDRIWLFLLLTGILVYLGAGADTSSGQEHNATFWRLHQTVQDILEGRNPEQAKATIGRGAHLVSGTKYEDLKAVVAGAVKSCSLADTSYHQVMIIAKTNLLEDMGFMILKTQTFDNRVRFHTIVFEKDSTGEYKIDSWQAGSSDK